MALSIEQVLYQAVNAHKEGRRDEAERLYRVILKHQPTHPDANHNLGVLAMSFGKSDIALPLFKEALKSNQKIEQFWFSYIEALIKKKQFQNAYHIVSQGKERGLSSEKLFAFESQLIKANCHFEAMEENDERLGWGIKQRDLGNYYDARNWFIQFVNNDPSNAEGWSQLSQIFILEKNDQEAEKALAKAQSLDNKLPSVHRNKARLALRRPDPIEALKWAWSANEIISHSINHSLENWIVLATCLGANNQNEEAFTFVEKALKINKNYAEAYATRSIIKLNTGDVTGSINDAEIAISVKPHLAHIWGLLGKLYDKQQRQIDGIDALKNAQRIEPGNLNFITDFANLLQKQGHFIEARAVFGKALIISPFNANTWKNIGIAFQHEKLFSSAKDVYKKSLIIDPQLLDSLNNLSIIARDDQEQQSALKTVQKSLIIDQNSVAALNILGGLHYDSHRLKEAAISLKKSIYLNPEDITIYVHLGVILRDLGRFDESVETYQQALVHSPNDEAVYNNLGVSLKDSLTLDAAELNYRRAIYLKPNYVNAYKNLSTLLQERGKLKSADNTCNKLLCNLRINKSKKDNPSITALLTFGRAGSLFLHSLIDGHPEIATLPGIYFKSWFDLDVWKHFSRNLSKNNWREDIVNTFMQEYEPFFDANCKKNVPGQPIGETQWLSKALGFAEMGANCSQPLVLDAKAFRNGLLMRLKTLDSINFSSFFELLHQVFETTMREKTSFDMQSNRDIFFHFHNPNSIERHNFLRYYPQAKFLVITRNPIQSLESWMMLTIQRETLTQNPTYKDIQDPMNWIHTWKTLVQKIIDIFSQMRVSNSEENNAVGVRLEDIKRNPKTTIPKIAQWIGISDHPTLYESSFCGLQYWGPSSKATKKITGFDTKSVDQQLGKLFSPRDVIIFETLFWPYSNLYGYADKDYDNFRSDLAKIRPWLNEPLEIERLLFSHLDNGNNSIEEIPQYRRLHLFLNRNWNILNHAGTYPFMTPPLQLKSDICR